MKRYVVPAALLLFAFLAPATRAWEYDPAAADPGGNRLSASLALLQSTWGNLRFCEGEIVSMGPTSLSLRTPKGETVQYEMLPGAAVYINGFPGSVSALVPVNGIPFFVRCCVEKRGRVILLDASFLGFECELVGLGADQLTVKCADGRLLTLDVWPAGIDRPLAPGQHLFLVLDSHGRARRVLGD